MCHGLYSLSQTGLAQRYDKKQEDGLWAFIFPNTHHRLLSGGEWVRKIYRSGRNGLIWQVSDDRWKIQKGETFFQGQFVWQGCHSVNIILNILWFLSNRRAIAVCDKRLFTVRGHVWCARHSAKGLISFHLVYPLDLNTIASFTSNIFQMKFTQLLRSRAKPLTQIW